MDSSKVTIEHLAPGEGFTIPPGQFAFLVTEEIVTIPSHALAFISIRAKIKFKGLVNVSGFHVDPGYRGQLTFAVFNAGPVTIHLKRGQPIFLIWYANLDQPSGSTKSGEVQRGIDPTVITSIAGELQSFASISKKIDNVDNGLGNRIHALEREQSYFRVIGAIALAFVVILIGSWVKDNFTSGEHRSGLNTATQPAVSSQNPSTGTAGSSTP